MKCYLCETKKATWDLIIGEKYVVEMCEECYKIYQKHYDTALKLYKQTN